MVAFPAPASILALFDDIVFPCPAEDLLRQSREKGIPEEFLRQLPAGQGHVFQSIDELCLTRGLIQEFQQAEEPAPAETLPTDEDRLTPTTPGTV